MLLFSMLPDAHSLLPPSLLHALGWTLIHTLWQGAAIALLLALLLPSLQRYPAHIRYLAAVWAQMLIFAGAALTFMWLFLPIDGSASAFTPHFWHDTVFQIDIAAPSTEHPGSLIARGRLFLDRHIQLVPTAWFFGVLLFALRLAGAWSYTRYMRAHQVFSVPLAWETRFKQLVQSMAIRPAVTLMESAMAHTPMVIGHIKPIVLLPVGMLTSLPPMQVEALIVHELAHIYRKDYLVNSWLSIHEILFFFHPATWWIRTIVHREREYCCDEMAVAICGNSLEYAKALSALPTLYPAKQPMLAMAATGKSGELLSRIKRILLEQPSNQHDLMEKIIATALIVGAASLLSMQADAAESSVAATPMARVQVSVALPSDTIPAGNITVRQEKEGKSIEVRTQNGKIISLQMDGRDIPAEDFHLYEAETAELLKKLPPVPPVPPRPALPPAPPAPGQQFFLFEEDTDRPHKERHLFIEGDSLFMDGRFRFDRSEDLFEEEIMPEEMARRMEEMARRMEEQGGRIRFHFDGGTDIDLDDAIEQGVREGLRGLREGLRGLRDGMNGLNLNFEWEEQDDAPSFDFRWEGKDPGARNTPFPPDAEQLGIFPGPRNRRLSPQQQIERALLRDALIDKRGTYKFELSDRVLKINGDKMPEPLRKKYQRLYEEASGFQWESKNRVIIHKAPGE